jgi:tRNA-specific 2-thiouridylase
LLAGKDKNKDQSYFLCQLSQQQLSKALFPIGELEKSEVRRIAHKTNLITADKKDSQGLCFVGKISLPIFLQQQLAPKEGIIIEIPEFFPDLMRYHQIPVNKENIVALSNPFSFLEKDGIEVAKHQGAHYYTIGQRKGLHVGGRPEPSYVIGLDTIENIVYTGQKDSHPGLNRHALKLEKSSLSWLQEITIPPKGLNCMVRIRYRQNFQKAVLLLHDEEYYILFEKKQRGITPGQFAAWYLKEELIGSAVIAH